MLQFGAKKKVVIVTTKMISSYDAITSQRAILSGHVVV